MPIAYARKRFRPRMTGMNEVVPANLLDREFAGYKLRTHLAGGLTYADVNGKWAYACLLVDLANRGIAGHFVGRTRDAGLVLAACVTPSIPR